MHEIKILDIKKYNDHINNKNIGKYREQSRGMVHILKSPIMYRKISELKNINFYYTKKEWKIVFGAFTKKAFIMFWTMIICNNPYFNIYKLSLFMDFLAILKRKKEVAK